MPTWNGAEELEKLLPALAAQELAGPAGVRELEICAIDSSSSDRTPELLARHGVRFRTIPQDEFGHGRTRNQVAEMASGDVLVFLSQDVLPADEHFLTNLLAAFEDDRVAGATARVLPHPDDDPLTARAVLDQPEGGEEGWVHELGEREGVWELDPATRARFLRFNNVASAIRADVFRELPFPDVAFGEDFAWASRALTAGWKIAFVPEARVHHAHAYDLGGAFERYRTDALFHYLAHGHRVRPTLGSALRGLAYELWQDARYIARNGRPIQLLQLLRAPGLRGAQILGQYLGSRGVGRPAGGPLAGELTL